MRSRTTIRGHLQRVLGSEGFVRSERMRRFLGYVVEEALDGRADSLKEYGIGLEVFDRPTSFDPRTDPIVRVEARRLRSKLARYYATEGRGDRLRVELPKGTYVPRFVEAEQEVESRENTVAVVPFANLSTDAESGYFSDGLTDEVIHGLTKAGGVRVVAGERRGKVRNVIGGSVRRAGDRWRIAARVVDASSGCYVWSEMFDRRMDDLFAVQGEVSGAIVRACATVGLHSEV